MHTTQFFFFFSRYYREERSSYTLYTTFIQRIRSVTVRVKVSLITILYHIGTPPHIHTYIHTHVYEADVQTQTQAPSPSLVRSHTPSCHHNQKNPHSRKKIVVIVIRGTGQEDIFVQYSSTDGAVCNNDDDNTTMPFVVLLFASCLPRRCRKRHTCSIDYNTRNHQGIEDVSQRRCQESTINKHTRASRNFSFVALHFYPPSRAF